MILPPMRKACRCKNRYCGHWQAVVAHWANLVAAGGIDCWRCGEPIAPDEPFDGGHDDEDPNIWRGPEHRAENRATSGRKQRTIRRWTL